MCITMNILSFTILLGIVVIAHSEKCPSSEEVHPCSCEPSTYSSKIILSCDGYKQKMSLEDIKPAIKSLAGKTEVDIFLRRINMGKVPSSFFKGIGVVSLDIVFCEWNNLTDGDLPILAGLEDSLEYLYVLSSFKWGPTQLSFGHLRKLKNLNMYGNTFNELSNKWFEKGPASLEILMLNGNHIQEIGDRAFSSLPNLGAITMVGNGISSISRHMFPSSAYNLEIMEFKDNDLTNIPADIFSDMPKLNIANFESNRIASLDQGTWESVWEQLRDAKLEGNPLVCDSSMNWMFDLRGPKLITGSCDAPTEKKGIQLKDFIKNRGQ